MWNKTWPMELGVIWSWPLFQLGMVQEESCVPGHPRTWQGELIFLHWCWLAFPDAAGERSSDFQDSFQHITLQVPSME